MSAKHLLAGQQAEDKALAALREQGLKLIARNYQCAVGELDLVMAECDTLVFVEVRYRKNRDFGNAAETINLNKRRRIVRTAQYFLQQHAKWRRAPMRIDVVALHGEKELDWIKDAFPGFG